jgi:hypothetical protein
MQVIVPPGRGRRPAPILYNVTRHLSETDIASLWEARKDGSTPKLQTLRYNHHLLAKAVASGKSLIECSNLTGLSGPRISDLKNDPAFQELVSYYAEELNEVYIDVHQRMAALGTSVLEELAERFESDPEKFTKRELMDLFTTMADRSIATAKGGPTPQQSVAVSPGGAGLALQINFVSPTGEGPQTIDATPVVNVLPAEGVRGEDQRALQTPHIELPFEREPEGLDGEPLSPDPAPYPTRPEILQAKRDLALKQIQEREAEVAERERIHEEYLRKKREQLNG